MLLNKEIKDINLNLIITIRNSIIILFVIVKNNIIFAYD